MSVVTIQQFKLTFAISLWSTASFLHSCWIWQSFSVTSHQVFFGLPLALTPSTSIFTHFSPSHSHPFLKQFTVVDDTVNLRGKFDACRSKRSRDISWQTWHCGKCLEKQQNSNILQCFISSQNCLNFTSMVGAGNGYEKSYKFFLQNARNSFAYFLKFFTLTHNI